MSKKILNILLVDDNPADCRLAKLTLVKSLQAIEFTVETAGSLAEGLELLGNKRFDLVLLDLGLPDSKGIETVDQPPFCRNDTAAEAHWRNIQTELDNKGNYVAKIPIFYVQSSDPESWTQTGKQG